MWTQQGGEDLLMKSAGTTAPLVIDNIVFDNSAAFSLPLELSKAEIPQRKNFEIPYRYLEEVFKSSHGVVFQTSW